MHKKGKINSGKRLKLSIFVQGYRLHSHLQQGGSRKVCTRVYKCCITWGNDMNSPEGTFVF